MSVQRNCQDNYPVAAMRHLIDAEILREQGRKDNAMCHYAFASECAIKALYEQFLTNHGRVLNHGVEMVWADMVQYCTAFRLLDTRTEILLGNTEIPVMLFEGHPDRRYKNDVLYTEEHLSQAEAFTGRLVDEILQEILDGAIDIKG